MPEVEFVNRELAESEAARAIELLGQSYSAKVEAWFAMQAVANEIGPVSNVGVRGIRWEISRPNYGQFKLKAECALGPVRTSTGAPATLEEARQSEQLENARALLARLIEEQGGLTEPSRRPQGTSSALLAAVVATPAGAEWAAGVKRPEKALLVMVRVADAYGTAGVNPQASLNAHLRLLPFDDRSHLVREFPTSLEAQAKAMSLHVERASAVGPLRPSDPRPDRELDAQSARGWPDSRSVRATDSRVAKIAIRAGVNRAEARTILRAVIDGRSKAKLMRAVNEAVRMVEEMEARESSKVAA